MPLLGRGKPSSKWLWSQPGPGHALATLPLPLPRLSCSHGKTPGVRAWIHWRLRQVLHRFHTLWLCHALVSDAGIINLMFSTTSLAIKKGSRRTKNEVPHGTKHQERFGPLCTHAPQHPIHLLLQGHPAICTWEYFCSIKSQICTPPALIGLTCWVVHVLPVEVVISYWWVLTPQQGNTAMPSPCAHQGR